MSGAEIIEKNFPPIPLSAGEKEIVLMVSVGKSRKEIAKARGVTQKTVSKMLERAFHKQHVPNAVSLIRKMVETGEIKLVKNPLLEKFEVLTETQQFFACMLASGRSRKEIAFEVGVTIKAIEYHWSVIKRRLKLDSYVKLTHLMFAIGKVKNLFVKEM